MFVLLLVSAVSSDMGDEKRCCESYPAPKDLSCRDLRACDKQCKDAGYNGSFCPVDYPTCYCLRCTGNQTSAAGRVLSPHKERN
ncbi:hypothetical protein ZWY2020_022859 [Hordeum vulgare]|nr:hypothetical protein ZWY2020_022859 [Hordeum vulgare]